VSIDPSAADWLVRRRVRLVGLDYLSVERFGRQPAANQRLHMELEHDGFAKEQPVVVSDTLDRMEFTLENRSGGAHETGLWIAGLPAGSYAVRVNGKNVTNVPGDAASTRVALPVAATGATRVEIARTK
jgi:hypothetical protein